MADCQPLTPLILDRRNIYMAQTTPVPSSLSGLDTSESDRRRALDVIDPFFRRDTLDELGLGTVRDVLADALFPGTSTIQTRARYFLFIPWIYRRLEALHFSSSRVAQQARKQELGLVEALVSSPDPDGVIGREARRQLKRLLARSTGLASAPGASGSSAARSSSTTAASTATTPRSTGPLVSRLMVFGQPRQDDLMAYLLARVGAEELERLRPLLQIELAPPNLDETSA